MDTVEKKEVIQCIEESFERKSDTTSLLKDRTLRDAINWSLQQLNEGSLRVAEKLDGEWVTHKWLKKAVLLSFVFYEKHWVDAGYTTFYDKIPLKYANKSHSQLEESGVRIVPHAIARYGSYQAPDVVLMPSYINIGAYVDSGTMVDTWSTVGSCAQIGRGVHLSGGVGIGGVLEPIQAQPTIIEDHCFIGARSEIVEGVVVEEGAVVSMGVFIGQSTRIYNRMDGSISYGRVPAGSVVVPGSLPAKNGSYSLNCAVIVKKVDQKTLIKVGLNAILREAEA